MVNRTKKGIVLILCGLIAFSMLPNYVFFAKAKSPKSSKSKTKSSSKKKSKSKGKSSSSKEQEKKSYFEIITDSLLVPGVHYKYANIKSGRVLYSLHIIEADLINSEVQAAVLKAGEQVNTLQKIQDISRYYDSVHHYRVLGAVNANFWRAYHNTPIGPTVIDGEVIELKTHKHWTSGFFDEDSRLYIDNYFLNGTVTFSGKNRFMVSNVNKRSDSLGIIVYNHYAGDTIPYLPPIEIPKVIPVQSTEAVQDTLFNDSTEAVIDSSALKQEIQIETRSAKLEYIFKKITVEYLNNPAVNRDVYCKVQSIDTGEVSTPQKGCIISLGADFPEKNIPKIGDTLCINFSTNFNKNVEFYNSVSGTPRLVRNGTAQHEAREEGSRGRRFINKRLPRTAIGTDRLRRKLFFVAVDHPGKSDGYGANLKDLSYIMKKIGCHNAMNLDGGGSTVMILGDRNIQYASRPEASRRISVALAIVIKHSPLFKTLEKMLDNEDE